MAVLYLEMGGDFARDPSRERSDSRIGNYIGREGVLKSIMSLLILIYQQLTLWEKRGLKSPGQLCPQASDTSAQLIHTP